MVHDAELSATSSSPALARPEQLAYRYQVRAPAAGADMILAAAQRSRRRCPLVGRRHHTRRRYPPRDTASLEATALPIARALPRHAHAPLLGAGGCGGAHGRPIDAGPGDVGRLLFVEYGLTFGDHWLMVPLEAPAGAVLRVTSLSVTDTFGVRQSVRAAADLDADRGDSSWRFLELSRDAGLDGPLVFIPRGHRHVGPGPRRGRLRTRRRGRCPLGDRSHHPRRRWSAAYRRYRATHTRKRRDRHVSTRPRRRPRVPSLSMARGRWRAVIHARQRPGCIRDRARRSSRAAEQPRARHRRAASDRAAVVVPAPPTAAITSFTCGRRSPCRRRRPRARVRQGAGAVMTRLAPHATALAVAVPAGRLLPRAAGVVARQPHRVRAVWLARRRPACDRRGAFLRVEPHHRGCAIGARLSSPPPLGDGHVIDRTYPRTRPVRLIHPRVEHRGGPRRPRHVDHEVEMKHVRVHIEPGSDHGPARRGRGDAHRAERRSQLVATSGIADRVHRAGIRPPGAAAFVAPASSIDGDTRQRMSSLVDDVAVDDGPIQRHRRLA